MLSLNTLYMLSCVLAVIIGFIQLLIWHENKETKGITLFLVFPALQIAAFASMSLYSFDSKLLAIALANFFLFFASLICVFSVARFFSYRGPLVLNYAIITVCAWLLFNWYLISEPYIYARVVIFDLLKITEVLLVGYLVYRFARKEYPHASVILIVHLVTVIVTYGLRTYYLAGLEDNAILKSPWFNLGLLISGIINPLFYCFAMAFLCNEKRAMDLRQLNEQARQDAEVRDLFLSTMSHEMRTPLNGIVGSAQLVMNYAEQPKAKPYCEAIINSAESLNVLIENVLEYAGIEGGKDILEEQDVDITQWLNNICLTLQPLARQKNIEFTIVNQLPKQSCYYFDQQKIRQVLNNLIGNAIKFTDQGYVKLSITVQGRDQLSHKIRFSVCDTGPGIPQQDIAKLTQPYVQSQAGRQKGGTGLGLSISERILNKFNSELAITSEMGRGSEFSFVLELALGELSLVERPVISKNCMQGLNVLLVEDMLLNQKIALEFLANDEHIVTLAKTGEEALAFIHQQAFDVVLLDMNLPDISGLEVLEKIKSTLHKNQQTPILAFTASLSPDEVKQYLALGISDIVAKPIKLEKLRQALFNSQQSTQKRLSHDIEEVLFDASAAQELERTFSADELSSVYDEFILSIHNKLSVCQSSVESDPEQVIKTLHRLASTALQLGFNQFGLALKHAERALLDKQNDIDFELLASLWRQTFSEYLNFAQRDL